MNKKLCAIIAAAALALVPSLRVAGQEASGAETGGGDFGFSLDLSYEYRLAPSGLLLVEETAVKSGIDLMRDYFGRAPLGRMAIGYGGDEGVSVALETTFRSQWEGEWYKADNLPGTGANPDPFSVENFFITRGVAYWRSPSLSFAFGRDRVDYGGILEGSLLPSTRLPYLDNLRARWSLGGFTVDYMVATIQAIKSWDGIDVDPSGNYLHPGAATVYGWESDDEATVIVEGLNRFSWRIGTFSIGFSDHAMIARRNNLFYLTDFFPIISRHQTAIEGTNNNAILDFAWAPLEGLDLAGQLGFDDINLNGIGIGDTGTPTTPAFVLGGRYRGAVDGNALKARFETGWTHYLYGNYDGSWIDPEGYVIPLMRLQYRFLSDSGALLLPLTSPYGPGAFWVEASGSLGIGTTGLTAGFDFLYLAKNPAANLIDTLIYDNVTTEDTPYIHFASLSLPLSYTWRNWLLSASPAVLVREGDWRFEATFLASYRLRLGNEARSEPSPWASPSP